MKQGKEMASKEKEVSLFLRVDLTEDEVRDAADRMADLYDRLKQVEEEQKSIAKNYMAKTKELEAQLSQAQLLVRNKYDQRLVDCIEVWNSIDSRVVTTRKDTGVVVSNRAMTADERQGELFTKDPLV